MLSKKEIEALKRKYPEGTMVELESMEDSYNPVPAGTRGKVVFVDDAGTIHVNWNNGSTLGLIPESDKFRVLPSVVDIFTERSRR